MSAPASTPFVFVSIPCYDALDPLAFEGLFFSAKKYRFYPKVGATSLTGQTFNLSWATCLNHRQQCGFTHFAMHHADIEAQPLWLDALMDEKERVGADILSVVIPIKDDYGRTTTGVMDPDSGRIRRLTMHEVMKLPETFSIDDVEPGKILAVNTGLWVCDLGPWVEEFPGFEVLTRIQTDPSGQKRAALLSEDWNFSRWAAKRGLKVFATRKVRVVHYGKKGYANDHAWGSLQTDEDDKPLETSSPVAATAPAMPQKEAFLSADRIREVESAIRKPKELTREIVVVRYSESLAWVHNWLDDLLVKHGPGLTYRIYDKGPDGDTPNVGNLDWTYLHHIVARWDQLADWTIFTQSDPFPHLRDADFAGLLQPDTKLVVPFLVQCREWNAEGRLDWFGEKFREQLPEWHRKYVNGSIQPAKLSLREWFQEYLGADIDKLGSLSYHPGAIFAVDRATIQRRPKAFYERLRDSLGESGHPSPEEAHYAERSWPLIFSTEQRNG